MQEGTISAIGIRNCHYSIDRGSRKAHILKHRPPNGERVEIPEPFLTKGIQQFLNLLPVVSLSKNATVLTHLISFRSLNNIL